MVREITENDFDGEITDKNYRKKGYATACLNFAKEIANVRIATR